MKKGERKAYGIFYAVNGLLLGILPKLLVCPHLQGTEPMLCWQTAQLETLMALTFIAAAVIIRFFARTKLAETFCHTAGFAAAWNGILLPMKITGGCASPSMLCNIAGYPVIYMVNGLVAAVALAAVVMPVLRNRAAAKGI